MLAQILRHPPKPLHGQDDLTDAQFDRHIELEKGVLAEDAVVLDAVTLLEAPHCGDQILGEDLFAAGLG